MPLIMKGFTPVEWLRTGHTVLGKRIVLQVSPQSAGYRWPLKQQISREGSVKVGLCHG